MKFSAKPAEGMEAYFGFFISSKSRYIIRQIMRLSLIIAVFSIATLQFLFASDTKAQRTAQVDVTMELKNESLLSAIKKIEQQTNFRFVFRNEDISSLKNINLSLEKRSVEETLNLIFKTSDLTFTELNGKVLISKSSNVERLNSTQELKLAGIVTDEGSLPLPGVSIQIKGVKGYSTATDKNGHFNISIADQNAIIVFTYIGYKSKEVRVGDQNSLKVMLQPEVGSLNEVQVIGYGTTTKRTNTGSVASITADEISKQPVGNPLAALSGRLSGVLIAQNNGVPGGAVQVQIRGQNSLSSGGVPLYVIDGVPFTNFTGAQPATDNLNSFATSGASGGLSPFAMINPSDIERIDILKDADATSIYGSRGANGVVLITTKRGVAGKAKIDVNLNTGFTEVNHFIPMMTLQEYLALRKEAFQNDGITPTAANAPDLMTWSQTDGTDWQKMFIGNKGHITDLQSSISGGSEQTKIFFNAGYRKESTVFPGENSDRRFTGRFNLDQSSVDKKFRINLSASYSNSNTDIPTADISSVYNLPPNLPLYDENGKLFWNPSFTNPLASLLRRYEGATSNLIANAILSYAVLPGLNAKVNVGYTLTRLDQHTTNPASSFNPASNPLSSAVFANSRSNNWIVEPTLDYTRKVGSGKLTGLIGVSWQENANNTQYITGSNYSNEDLLGTLRGAGLLTANYNNIVGYKYDAIFGKLNYDLQEKYLVNVTFRRDGSSRFGPLNRFGSFGAIGAGWVFSKESFITDHLPFLSFGKLRGSYGTTGNDQISNYLYLTLYSPSTTYLGAASTSVTSLANESIQWETTKKLEFALDLGFLKDRISLTANYYRNRSTDQITSAALPTQAGYNSYTLNLPALIQNKGLELELNTTNINKDDFSWKSSLNVTFTDNKLLDFPGLEKSFFASNYIIGEPLNLIRLYHFAGVNAATGAATYEDRDGINGVTSADRYVADQGTPYFGGFNNSFTYKSFELGVFFQFNHRFGVTKILNTRPGAFVNQNTYWNDRWSPSNTDSNIPGSSSSTGTAITNSYGLYSSSDAVYGDASYVKLRSVSLSYTLPSKWVRLVKMNNCRLFMQGQNLFTWAKNKYVLDTETTVQGGPSGLGTGTIGQVLPPLRTIVFGVNCSF
jgi:TonB-linked SusC/RagA family outer membrane protein